MKNLKFRYWVWNFGWIGYVYECVDWILYQNKTKQNMHFALPVPLIWKFSC